MDSIHIELHSMQSLGENKALSSDLQFRADYLKLEHSVAGAQSKQSCSEPLEKRRLKQRHEALTKMVGPARLSRVLLLYDIVP